LNPPRRREVEFLRDPLRMVFVPIAHDFIHAPTIHTARQVARLLYEVTKENRAWHHFKVVDVAVQGLVHSKDGACHATAAPPQLLLNSLSQRCTEVKGDTICAPLCRCDQITRGPLPTLNASIARLLDKTQVFFLRHDEGFISIDIILCHTAGSESCLTGRHPTAREQLS
jgi:hypothetical protein